MTEAALSSSRSIADVLADSISKIHVSRCHANSPFIALRIGGNILSKHKSLHEIESQKTLILSLCMSMLFLTFPKKEFPVKIRSGHQAHPLLITFYRSSVSLLLQ